MMISIIKYMWIARDKCGALYLFRDKPSLDADAGRETYCPGYNCPDEYFRLDDKLMPQVTFKNSPLKVKLTL